MITKKHLEIYKFYKGDGDGFIRCAIDEEKKIMTYHYWKLINDFLQDIYLVKKGKASVSYEKRLFYNLKINCENGEVVNELIRMAENGLV